MPDALHPRLAALEKHIAEHKALIQDLENLSAESGQNPYYKKLVDNARAHQQHLRRERYRLAKPDSNLGARTQAVASSLHLSLRNHLPRTLDPALLLSAAERIIFVVFGGRRAKAAKKGGEAKRAKRHAVRMKAIQLDRLRRKDGIYEPARKAFKEIEPKLAAFVKANGHRMLSAKVLIAEIAKARKAEKGPSA